MSLAPFHLAIAVHDLSAARAFYGGVFGCSEGRSSSAWVDFDLFGHQLVAHLDRGLRPRVQATFFLNDPSGNALEFKAFRDIGRLFSK
ncbi:MAG TPA: hypothetical protein VJQ47_14760 [Steroidobacteraceae bacterium]|nr:hypothetical protein [Steroidobacteraceae bacterium]